MKLYVASSWRNKIKHQIVVQVLRNQGHECYDFTNPELGNNGFHWSDIDTKWKSWTPDQFRDNLLDPIAVKAFNLDYGAMKWADAGVLVTPCGRSAHLEAGFFVGSEKPLIILLSDGEPELMYSMASDICVSTEEVIRSLEVYEIRDGYNKQ